jgi:hypothetical protein
MNAATDWISRHIPRLARASIIDTPLFTDSVAKALSSRM